MTPLAWYRWLQELPQNPVYIRERGGWGKPNPFYETLLRFLPFIILGGIALGFFAGFSNPLLFNGNDDLFAVWCLLCLPGVLLSMITIIGSLLAPALTAPMISLEKDQGTWEILLTTPQPRLSLLLAKLLGALRRLRLWPVLFMLSIFQGLIVFCSLSLMNGQATIWNWLLGFATILRPGTEILFAAFTGLLFSTAVRSATMALVSTYSLVVVLKLFNSSLVWISLVGQNLDDEVASIAIGTIGPTLFYAAAIIVVWIGILYQVQKMGK